MLKTSGAYHHAVYYEMLVNKFTACIPENYEGRAHVRKNSWAFCDVALRQVVSASCTSVSKLITSIVNMRPIVT